MSLAEDGATDSIEAARRRDAACDSFEAAWVAGQALRIESLVNKFATAERPQLLVQLLRLELYYRHKAGERLNIDEYRLRFSGDRHIVDQAFLHALPGASADQPTDSTRSYATPKEAEKLPPEATQAPCNDFPFLGMRQAPDEIGRLGPYRILRVLGKGGMGMVFCAEDPLLNRQVALKIILPKFVASAASQQRFLEEARAIAALRHDSIISIHHIGNEGGVPYLVMPLLQGETLAQRLAREQRVPVYEMLPIAQQVAAGLAAIHASGMVHRDIKPGNLWLESDGRRVKIIDFGLAYKYNSQLDCGGSLLGTPGYMSPEQAYNGAVDWRSDLFCLGCVFYEMLTGQKAFPPLLLPSQTLIDQKQEEWLQRLGAAAPRELVGIIIRLLVFDPDRRLGPTHEISARLDRFVVDMKK